MLPSVSGPLLRLDREHIRNLPPFLLLFWAPGYGHSAADREHAPQQKSGENANIQPNPGLILRAEPTVTNILKVSERRLPLPPGSLPSFQFSLSFQRSTQRPEPSLCSGSIRSYLGSRERGSARKAAIETAIC